MNTKLARRKHRVLVALLALGLAVTSLSPFAAQPAAGFSGMAGMNDLADRRPAPTAAAGAAVIELHDLPAPNDARTPSRP
jgi:hypothetical protein